MELPPKSDDAIAQSTEEMQIADDYRQQLQSRFRNELAITPEELPSMRSNFRSVTAAMMTISFDCHDPKIIAERERELENWVNGIVVSTPLDKPGTHGLVQARCREVEAALRELNIPFGEVAYGSVPTGENVFECGHVQTTDASVILLSEGFLSFCLVLGKVFALSLLHTRDGDHAFATFEHDKVIARIREDAELQDKWFELFDAYARGLGAAAVKHRYISPPASRTAYQLLFAMERFTVAHEYAHHVMKHGRSDPAEVPESRSSANLGDFPPGYTEEFAADLMALSISARIDTPPDTFTSSGGGAVLLLKGLECVKLARNVLLHGADEIVSSSIHPSTSHRLIVFDVLYENLPQDKKERYKTIRDNFAAIVDSIWILLRPRFLEMHANGVRPINRDSGWLPK